MPHEEPGTRWGGGDGVPFPVASKDVYAKVLSREAFVAAGDKAPIVTVPLARLHATQPTIDPNEVENMVEHAPHVTDGKRNKFGLLIDKPMVIKYGNELYIHDGHHRLSAAKYRGDSDAVVRFIDLDAMSADLRAFARTDSLDAAE